MTVDSESKPKDPVICSVTPLSVVEAFKPYSSGIAEAMDGATMNAAANASPILDGRAIPPSAWIIPAKKLIDATGLAARGGVGKCLRLRVRGGTVE